MDEVFEAFRNCISDWKCTNRDCPYESKCRIANGNDQYLQIPKHLALDVLNELKEQPEIVRCKDCEHKVDTLDDYDDYEGNCPCYCSGDPFYSWVPDDDWFCADGKRKEK